MVRTKNRSEIDRVAPFLDYVRCALRHNRLWEQRRQKEQHGNVEARARDTIYEINAAITTEVGACNLVSLAMITKKRTFQTKSSCAKYQDRTSRH